MSISTATLISDQYCMTHERALKLTDKLSDEQLRWRPTPTGHSIAFHLWHMARWADHLQAAIPGMTPELGGQLGPRVEIWEAERLAVRWGFDLVELGYAQTGMTMSDVIATQLAFPEKGNYWHTRERHLRRLNMLSKQSMMSSFKKWSSRNR